MRVSNIAKEFLEYDYPHPKPEKHQAIDNTISSSEITASSDINSNFLNIITSITHKVLWVFNVTPTDHKQRIKDILIANKFIAKE